MSKLYDEQDYQVRDTKGTIFYSIQKFEYEAVLKQIMKIIDTKNSSLLDFGAGKGLFLNFAQELGFKVKGVETSIPRASYAQQVFGLEIATNTYNGGEILGGNFNVITLFHVLEHLDQPKNLLKNLVVNNLNPKGLLVVEVPNILSWQAKLAGKHWLHLDIPRHLSHFSEEKLFNILNDMNLTIIKKEFFSWHLGVIGMMQSIWTWFGYKGFLIGDLKEKKTIILMLLIAISLPFAILLELIASLCNKGGVMRYYAQNKIS
nr:class I SAM-dependent methyltransferase [Pseudopedobacter sp.]